VSLWAPASPIVIVEDQEFSTGIIGLIAGELTEEYYRPAVAIALTDHAARGSARSIPEFNIVEAFRACADLFTRYGGHAQAAGFEMPSDPDRIGELKARLQAIAAERLDLDQLQPTLDIDAQMSLATLQGETYAFLRSLSPFGPANPEPLFLSRGVKVVDKREIGADGQHLRLKLQEGKVTWDAIAFNPGTKAKAEWRRLDLVYTLGVNTWGGAETLQLRVVDFAPS
ncbi:MAG: single-stranded-DNA-specific exonuclease RecJ, partial [Chloroflexi bacterium]|nr:single-stranded-DNA-specific exonuclease RecJ [Chloroflexota bacterium]